MVDKFYAYYKGQKINAYKALRLKNRSEITTSPVTKAELFDSLGDEKYPLKPVKGRNGRGLPYFAYYSNYKPEGNSLDQRHRNETFAHAVYQDVFLRLAQFTFVDGNERILVSVDKVTVDTIVRVNDKNYYIVDVMYTLKETSPYSYYYKWNGQLSLEIVVTTIVAKEKQEFLSEKGIQLASLQVPRSVQQKLSEIEVNMINDELPESIYEQQVTHYKNLYETGKFDVWAKLLGRVKTKDGWKERYFQMKAYEEQVKKMEAQIERLNNRINQLQQTENDKQKNILNLQSKEVEARRRIADRDSSERERRDLESRYKQLSTEYNAVREKNQRLNNENQLLDSKIQELENQSILSAIKSFFKK